MIIPICIFLVTLFLIITQPKGLQIGTTAILGAIIALILGVVSINDVLDVTNIVWDATLAFIGIIILSLVLDEIGFFEWCALKMAKFSKGSGIRMFIYSILLGSFVSALFANDGAALILTPILLAKMRVLQLSTKTIIAFLLAGGFISDSASLPFVFSNLTNIVTANYFNIGFVDYFLNMIIPFIVSVISSIVFLWLILRKDIPKKVDIRLLKEPKSVIILIPCLKKPIYISPAPGIREQINRRKPLFCFCMLVTSICYSIGNRINVVDNFLGSIRDSICNSI
jgi:arsenical pump membrane protein